MNITKPTNLNPDDYFTYYIEIAPNVDLISSLNDSLEQILGVFKELKEEDGLYKYAEGKWTIKQLLRHIIDTERILAYRALRFGRNDATEIPGFSEDHYAENDYSENTTLDELKNELFAVRTSTIALFKTMNGQYLDHQVKSNGVELSSRMLGFIISGHGLHHICVLKDIYMNGINS